MDKPQYSDLYKSTKGKQRANQEDRRRRLLNDQRQQRLEQQDEHRDIEPQKCNHPMRRPRYFHEIFGPHLKLQLSEWLREKPSDLPDWILIPCPRGQRCFLVAYRQHTIMYNRSGRSCFTFQSLLPGDTGNHKNLTILDCIYDAGTDTFFILDVLAFGSQRFRFCEAQMRFFWLKSKFNEEPYGEVGETNEKRLILLPHHPMDDDEAVRQVFQQPQPWPDNQPPLDGFLFYHKDASYTCGTTPLVGWLFPFMVPDILHEEVHPDFERPMDYADPHDYMDHFDRQQNAKRQPKGKRSYYDNPRQPYPGAEQMRAMGYCDEQSQRELTAYLKSQREGQRNPSNAVLQKNMERRYPYVFEYDDDAGLGNAQAGPDAEVEAEAEAEASSEELGMDADFGGESEEEMLDCDGAREGQRPPVGCH